MVANGYAPRRFSPGSMGVALAINGGLIAALLLLGSQAIAPPVDDSLIVENVPLPPPPTLPEPPKPQPREQVEPAPMPQPFVPDPIITVPNDRPAIDSTDVLPTFPPPTTMPGPLTGAGTSEAVVVDPPKPAPVLVDAAPDSRYLDDFQPPYPPSERRAERDGTVTVRVQIGANGRVLAVESVRATSEAFFEATKRQALSRWRFRPATRDGAAVESTRVMTVRFEMEQ